MQAKDPGYYIGRRAIIATLGGSGVRVSELCDIRIRDLRLHAASGAHFRSPDAKTEAGIREVQVSLTSSKRSLRTSTDCAAPTSRPNPTPTCSPTARADG
jgi:integrase